MFRVVSTCTLATVLALFILPIGSVRSFQVRPMRVHDYCYKSSFSSPCGQRACAASAEELTATCSADEDLARSEKVDGAISNKSERQSCSRRMLLAALWSTAVLTANTASVARAVPEQKNYSSNARNMARLSSGDKSGGSVYDNNPQSAGAAKRRAMLGCKTNSSRNLAGKEAGIEKGFSEKDCNLRVMDGDTEFMLKALRKLDCPTCPYGIEGG